jgi:DNA-binding response OmpR family regulator
MRRAEAASRTKISNTWRPKKGGSGVRILLVEDDSRLAKRIQQVLLEERHLVEVVGDGQSALFQAAGGDYDVVILDILLPELNGIAVCRWLRDHQVTTPILLLTALDTVGDKVRGLDSGADDYLTKPFSFDELLARLRVLERRKAVPFQITTELHLGTLTLHLLTRVVQVGGITLDLTVREFALLEYLLRHPNQALTRSQILSAVWPSDTDVAPGIVDTYIHYLRTKLHASPGAPQVRTIRTIGYLLSGPITLGQPAGPPGEGSSR